MRSVRRRSVSCAAPDPYLRHRRGQARRVPPDSRSNCWRLARDLDPERAPVHTPHLSAGTLPLRLRRKWNRSNSVAPAPPMPAHSFGLLPPHAPARRLHLCLDQGREAGRGCGDRGRTPPDSRDATPCSKLPPLHPAQAVSPVELACSIAIAEKSDRSPTPMRSLATATG